MEARSSISLKGERLPEKANDLYCLLNKKRIRGEKKRRNREGRKKRGEDCERGQGVTERS